MEPRVEPIAADQLIVSTALDDATAVQHEDLLAYFVGTEQQLAELEEHFDLYTGHYLDYIELYERQRLN